MQKRRWARAKDLEDIRGILLLQGDALNFAYVERWTRLHGTSARLEEVWRAPPTEM